jgi:hypothetical protein
MASFMHDYNALLPFCHNDTQRKTLAAIITYGSQNKAAKHFGMHRSTIDRRVTAIQDQAEKQGLLGDHKIKGTVPAGFYAETSVKRRLCPETGEMLVTEDWTKSRLDKGLQHAAYVNFIEGLSDYIKPAKPVKPNLHNYSIDLASAIIFGDPHIGMLAHAIETGVEDYDMDKSIQDIKASIDYCVDIAPASEEGWFINVGDLTHAANTRGTTFNGTPVDLSARHNQTLRAAGVVIRYCITKMLTKFKTVKVINARGNHDGDAAFAVNMFLEGVYEFEPRVEVFGNDSKFAFIEFGKNLVMVNHGDQINANRMAGVMTRLGAAAWGRTLYHHIWMGHIHHKTTLEHDSGAVLRSFPILAPIDGWHADSGYGAGRGVTMITMHREFGQVSEYEPSIQMIRSIVR